MKRAALALALCTSAGCGTLEQPSAGDTNLPNNRTGPFQLVEANALEGGRCVLSSPEASIEDPDVIIGDSGEFIVFASRLDAQGSVILRAVLDANLRLREASAPVLPPVRAARSPTVVRDAQGWVMAYARAGAVEVALSGDGRAWNPRSVPLLTPDPREGEREELSGPSLARSDDGRWWLAYASAGSVWIARGASPLGPYERVDGDPTRGGRQAVMAASTASPLTRFTNPTLRIERSGAGRSLWRVYATEQTERAADGGLVRTQSISLAASWDGARFTLAATPAFASRGEPTPDAPGAYFERSTRSWMFMSGGCGGSSRGVRVAVFPAGEGLPLRP